MISDNVRHREVIGKIMRSGARPPGFEPWLCTSLAV